MADFTPLMPKSKINDVIHKFGYDVDGIAGDHASTMDYRKFGCENEMQGIPP